MGYAKRFLLIPDKFKGSLTAEQVVDVLSKSIKKVFPEAHITAVQASDGGDGFLDSVNRYSNANEVLVDTTDSLGRTLKAPMLFDAESGAAYVELARASGLVLLRNDERNPLLTSTYGTGLQLKKAMKLGAQSVYLGLGGSSTNDGGCGLASALGYRFFNKNGKELPPTGNSLVKIREIKKPDRFEQVSFYAINDVNNPLFGKDGAAHVYGAQKGADREVILRLDEGLRNLHEIVKRTFGLDVAHIPGAGAAGGAAYGLKVFCGAQFFSGVDFLMKLAHVDKLMQANCFDAIITGEGKIDAQTVHGKLIKGVLDFGKEHDTPVIAVCGMLDLTQEVREQLAIQDIIEIGRPDKSLEYNIKHADLLLENAVISYFKNRA